MNNKSSNIDTIDFDITPWDVAPLMNDKKSPEFSKVQQNTISPKKVFLRRRQQAKLIYNYYKQDKISALNSTGSRLYSGKTLQELQTELLQSHLSCSLQIEPKTQQISKSLNGTLRLFRNTFISKTPPMTNTTRNYSLKAQSLKKKSAGYKVIRRSLLPEKAAFVTESIEQITHPYSFSFFRSSKLCQSDTRHHRRGGLLKRELPFL